MPPIGSTHCPHCDRTPETANLFPFGESDCKCGQKVFHLTINGEILFFCRQEAPLVKQLFRRAMAMQEFEEVLQLDMFDMIEMRSAFEDALDSAI